MMIEIRRDHYRKLALTWKEHKTSFWDARNILHLDLSSDKIDV